jgi:hypothetical protein
MNRKSFFQNSALMSGGLLLSPLILPSQVSKDQVDPQLDKELVRVFVGAGHRDMAQVKTMLEEHPTLLNAAHDWKYGDFETCLGAANHVGYKELVQYLLDQGAQANIFTAALFGKMEILKPYLDAFPKCLNARGPHGYTLLHHAIQGEDEALEVKEYLVSLGAVETKIALY